MKVSRRTACPAVLLTLVAGSVVPVGCSLMIPDDLANGSATAQEPSTSGDASADAIVDDVRDAPTDTDAAADADAATDAGPLAYEQTVLADRPVSYWHLDESAGVILADAMGRHPLTIAKASVTLSTAGATGTGTSILLPGTASLEGDIAFDLQGVKPFTIELWMRPTSTDTYLDELAFYGKALSAERVKAHFDAAH